MSREWEFIEGRGTEYPLPTAYASGLARPSSPAFSTASSCTLRGDSPDPEPKSLQTSFSRLSIERRAQPQFTFPPTPPDSGRKRPRVDDNANAGVSNFTGEGMRRTLDFKERAGRRKPEVVDLTKDDKPVSANLPRPEVIVIDDEEVRVRVEAGIFNLHIGPKQPRDFAARRPPPRRNPPILLPFKEVNNVKWNSSFLKAGKVVSLKDTTFLHIAKVVQNQVTDAVTLRGWQLKRNRDFDGLLPKQRNELCYVHEVELDDDRPMLEQSVIEVPLDQVLNIRRVIFTNKLFPECRYDKTQLPGGDQEFLQNYVEENELLVVRRRYITEYKDAQSPGQAQVDFVRKLFRKLTVDECTTGYSDTSEQQRFQWRGETVLGGSGIGKGATRPHICEKCLRAYDKLERLRNHEPEHNGEKRQPNGRVNKIWPWMEAKEKKFFEESLGALPGGDGGSRHSSTISRGNPGVSSHQTYTFADAFSCAGGVSRGARKAGLRVSVAFDCDPNPGATWRTNFPAALFLNKFSDEFCALEDPWHNLYVDILHISPPCQPFSPAHTKDGPNDDRNRAAFLAVGEVIKKCRPRMVTLEETFGILFDGHKWWWQTLIHALTDLGFDVSWQNVEMQRWGLPQTRKRVVVFASAPGETLPEMPAYTHHEFPTGSLKKFNSVRSVLSKIPNNALNHDTSSGRGNYKPWDDSGLIGCITTGGAEGTCHPNGKRGWTHRELASLQGFPLKHVFRGLEIRKQIGNAVPPTIAKILLKAVRKRLEMTDGVVRDGEEIDDDSDED